MFKQLNLLLFFACLSLGYAQNATSPDPFNEKTSSSASSSATSSATHLSSSYFISSSSASAVPQVTDTAILNKFKRINGELETTQTIASKEAPAPTSLGTFLIQLSLALILVIGLIWLSVWGLKKLQKSRLIFPGSENGIQVIEQSYLGPQQRVVVVRIHDKVLALGVTQQNIQFLHDLSNEEAYQNNENTAKQFSGTVDYFLKQFKRPSPPSTPPTEIK